MSTFGERLRAARKARHLKQEAVASCVNCAHDMISEMELGNHESHATRFVVLADILHVSLDWLMAGRGKGPALDSDTSLHRAIRRGKRVGSVA